MTEAELDTWRDEHGEDLTSPGCCDAECYALDRSTPEQPCWGSIDAMDEVEMGDDYIWVHACDGHAPEWMGGEYLPRSPGAGADRMGSMNRPGWVYHTTATIDGDVVLETEHNRCDKCGHDRLVLCVRDADSSNAFALLCQGCIGELFAMTVER